MWSSLLGGILVRPWARWAAGVVLAALIAIDHGGQRLFIFRVVHGGVFSSHRPLYALDDGRHR